MQKWIFHPVKVLPFNPVPETSEDSSKLLGSPNQKLEPTEQGPARPGRWSSHFPSRQDPAAIWPGSTRPIRQKAGRHRDRQGHWGCRRQFRPSSSSLASPSQPPPSHHSRSRHTRRDRGASGLNLDRRLQDCWLDPRLMPGFQRSLV